jgi:two-component system, LytTR family, sensor histidine kinase AlgZ
VHPILTSRNRTIAYVAAWIPVAALLIGIVTRGGAISIGEAATILVPMCFIYAFICQASWYLCAAVPIRQTGTARLMSTHLTAAAVSSVIWIGIGWLWVGTLDSSGYVEGIQGRYVVQLPILFFSGLLLFSLAVALNYLLMTFETSQLAEKKALELQVLNREAELKALRAQIDPHFLFNCLNSISALITIDAVAARRMCVLLADFFRGCLKLGSRQSISLSEEIHLAECYLDIERVRLGSRLQVERQIDRESELCMVPPLIMHPLIENAITHGIAPMVEGGTVRVQAERNSAGVRITVENPYDPELGAKTGAGLGLKNVRMRLANLYSDDARLDIDREGTRFKVQLQLPCQSAS